MTTPVLVYRPSEAPYRICWYGGTRLHFEKLWDLFDLDTDAKWQEWRDRDVRTLGNGIPKGMKEMLMEMEDYYQYSMDMELERRAQLM